MTVQGYAFVIGVASRLRVTASQEGCVAAAAARPGGKRQVRRLSQTRKE